MTQTQAVLHMLRFRGDLGVTALEAQRDIGTMRLAARIADLRAEGYVITARMVTVPTRGAKARVARYYLEEKPEQLAAFG